MPVKAHFMMIGSMQGWLVSPESLAIFGRGIGVSGIWIIIPLAAAMFLAICYTALMRRSELHPDGNMGEHAILSSAFGRTAAAALVLAGRIPVFLFASIAMLVSAGFAFNEIFVYWFPNFLFASLLLLTICILHFYQEKAALWGQVVFVGIAILGLLILIVMGFGEKGAGAVSSPLPAPPFYLFGTTFLLFLGVDFYRPQAKEKMTPYLVPVLSFLLLMAWALPAVERVSPTRLADATLPHILIARALGGDAGHWIIGVVIISGALSGVNGFLLAVRRTLSELSENHFFPKIAGKGWSAAIVAGAAVEIMMMTGAAGDDRIDVSLRASLFLWLMYAGFRSVAAALHAHRFGAPGKVHAGAVAGVIFMLTILLMAAESHLGHVITFQSAAIIGFLLFSFIWTKTYGKFSQSEMKQEG
ncbi:MAG: hypothetical protein WA151_00725 [Desulfatirhabdiaceae bacterium]